MVYTVYVRIYTYLYLAISTEQVLILAPKLVYHVHNMGNACVMQSQPAFLPPRITLSQCRALPEARHHAKHPPSSCFA